MSKIDEVNAFIQNRMAHNNRLIERERMAFTKNADTKHDRLWSEAGYPEEITPEMYRQTYERHPAATAGVHRVLDKCWSKFPEILEKDKDDKAETPWETEINDGLAWDQPIASSKTRLTKARAITRFIPAWEEQIRPSEWDNDESSENYGQPKMWEYQESFADNFDTDGKPQRSVSIHPDRIIVLAEGALDGSIYSGIPLLRAGFNSLIDMAKISGSSAEGFLKNASRQLNVNYNKENVSAQSLAQQMGVTMDELGDVLNEDVARLNDAIDAAMFTMGADVKVLSVTPADPQPSWTVAANQFAASIQKPFTIIFGQQTGRLASDEDKTDDANSAMQRRHGFLNWLIITIVERLAKFGIVSAAPSEIEVEWDDLLAPTDSQKVELASKLADIN
ncbi:hypothetical protein GH714_044088 [Hevea brasiliensis]|uniref:Anti-CBASS protein Acb1-like N-terminal domain-containing protein n=1 Tax=Hevea brasiliensis TaxID=3981 RepID=A0A6A6K125_HEVBR|nr:hypothetical protein GH714_044088 [Hevea brasiliensis]